MKKVLSATIIFVITFCSSCSMKNGNDSIHRNMNQDTLSKEDHQESGHTESEQNDHTVITLKHQPFSVVVKTSGRIGVDNKDIEIISSKSSGIVKLNDHFLFPGVKVSKGQRLFTISGEQLSEDNSELQLNQVTSDMNKASANYERAKKLYPDKIITEEHFLTIKNEYEKTLNEYNNLKGSYDKDGNSAYSPATGYIKDIYITEGQKVTSGQSLATIVIEHNLVLKADISPDYLGILNSIEKAHFKVGYSDRLFKTEEMNGKKISFGKSTGDNSFYIPVYFRMNNDKDLIDGTFAEVYLIGEEIQDAIVVPNSALMEEYGKLYVYVEDFDGDFLKRYITTGYNNGEETQVISGLSENEKIVATGTYFVKLSQMSNSAPAHNH